MIEALLGAVIVLLFWIGYLLCNILYKLRDIAVDQVSDTNFIMMTAQVRDAINKLDSD